ncbi:MAG: UDP-N-acetylmuramoyl-tripeptide--D-alanyl-D-alanine ligase, partial [Salinibacterium sp.]|nr:UDP-N-acetylmuramoyl-tripeptide--D-alanyl-D-alanine ligase [Salinibacterium sp.]
VTDGHLFVDQAHEAGAAVAVVERELDVEIAQIVVTSSLVALSALAKDVLDRVRSDGRAKGSPLRVVAVTGSNGKTTTKNMLRGIFEAEGPTIAPRGSFNNEVGAPISILEVDYDTRFLVVEMGADSVGDVRKLVAVATPDVGVVLTVGMAHIGKFGDQDAIARAKAEMVTDLPVSAVAVLNADDGRVAAMAELTRATVQWFGLGQGTDVRADDLEATASGTHFTLRVDGQSRPVILRILGEHHVSNALAAITAARAVGIPVERSVAALEQMRLAERWRMQLLDAANGITIINDAYNASPESVVAALKTLAQLSRGARRSVAVLGEMAELGDFADEEHDRIGRLVVRLNIKKLIVVGHAARHIHNAAGLEGSWDGESVLVADIDEAYDVLRDELRDGDIVLVKSSNSAGLRLLGDRLAGVDS